MKKITLITALTLFFIIAILPLLLLFIDSFICNGRFSLASYQTALFDARRLGLLKNSLIIASVATVGSLLIGAPCAFFMTRTDLAINKYVRYLWFIPLIIPPHVNAIAWIYLLGHNGAINQFVKQLLPQADIFFNIYTLSGVIFVLTLSYFPVIVILINSGLCSADRKLEDSGQLYLPVIYVFRKITLPLIRPHLLAGGLLVFIFAVSDYGVSSLLRINSYPVEIFAYFSAFYDSKAAAALATPIMAIICLLALLQWRCMRNREYITIGSGVSSVRAFALSRWQIPACGFVLSIIIIAVAAPLSILMVESGSLQTFQTALKTAYRPIINSLIISLTAATGTMLISFFIAYIIEKTDWPGKHALDILTFIPFAVPSEILGIAMIKVWNQPGLTIIYDSLIIVVFAYIARFTPFAVKAISGSLKQINANLEESSLLTNPSWCRHITKIMAPLTQSGLIAGWIITFIFCMRELGATLLIVPPGKTTLSVRIYSLIHYGAGNLVAALCIILIVITLVPVVSAFRFSKTYPNG